MHHFLPSDFLIAPFWVGWRRTLVYVLCVIVIILLGGLRTATDAELAFASLAMVPVLVMAWVGGKWAGITMAFLAAVMWNVADIYTDRTFSAHWIPWLNGFIRFLTYGFVVLLVLQVRLQYAREREHATRDALTGLLNRRSFVTAADAEVDRATRYGSHFTVVFLDLDNFKALNDTQGHAIGDVALRATAMALVDATRSTDIVARMGGDEFAVIFPEVDSDAADVAAHKLFDKVNQALAQYTPVGVSIGVAWFDVPNGSLSMMLKAADDLMYAVKADGKNNLLTRRYCSSDFANGG